MTEGTEEPDDQSHESTGRPAAGPPGLAGSPALSRSRLVWATATVVLVAALVLAGTFLLRPDPESTSRPSTTATEPAPAIRADALVATARNPSITVRSSPPPGWDSAAPVVRFAADTPDLSQPKVPQRPALPRPDYPVQGRYSDPEGWRFDNPTSLGDPFTMLVAERRGDWLAVHLPVRPNGTVGWVPVSEVTLSSTDQRIELRLAERVLRFWEGDTLVLSTPVVVGAEATPTPTGRFYVTDTVVQTNPDGAYGPLVIATNAYSEALDIFDDGVPVIALHGTNRPELVGQAVSNGCVRLPNDAVSELGRRIRLGVPVDIWP